MSDRSHTNHNLQAPAVQPDLAAPAMLAHPPNAPSLSLPSFPLTNFSNSNSCLGYQSTYPHNPHSYAGASNYSYGQVSPASSQHLPSEKHRYAFNGSSLGVQSNGKLQIAADSVVSPTNGSMVRANYSTTTPELPRHVHHQQHMDANRPSYANHTADSQRLVSEQDSNISTYDYGTDMYDQPPMVGSASEGPPERMPEFCQELQTHGIQDGQGNLITPRINAKIEKGMRDAFNETFYCYRRNYFGVNVSYTFGPSPSTGGGHLYLYKKDDKSPSALRQIQSLALWLTAKADGVTGKTIHLIQHTPKRDKGPQYAVKKVQLQPMPAQSSMNHRGFGAHLYPAGYSLPGHQPHSNHSLHPQHSSHFPVQNGARDVSLAADSSNTNAASPHAYAHSYERIQFKSATANNGKRRAQQQYFHLVVEMYADVRMTLDDPPEWVKIGLIGSDPIVVRGRSPSHYVFDDTSITDRRQRTTKAKISASRALPQQQDWPTYPQWSQTVTPRHATHTAAEYYQPIHPVAHHVPAHHELPEPTRHHMVNVSAAPVAAIISHPQEDMKPVGYSYHPQALPFPMAMSRADESAHGSQNVTMNGGRSHVDLAVETSRGLYHYGTAEQLNRTMTSE